MNKLEMQQQLFITIKAYEQNMRHEGNDFNLTFSFFKKVCAIIFFSESIELISSETAKELLTDMNNVLDNLS